LPETAFAEGLLVAMKKAISAPAFAFTTRIPEIAIAAFVALVTA